MASVPVEKLSQTERDQLAISYAAFILQGSGAEVNADSLNAVLKAAGVAANAGLVSAVAKALKGRNVTEFFGGVGGGSAATSSAPASTPVAETKAASKPQEKAKEAPPPPPPAAEEEDMDMGDLFGWSTLDYLTHYNNIIYHLRQPRWSLDGPFIIGKDLI